MPTIQLIQKDNYCPNYVQLEAPSNFDLEKCAEIVSLSKGKNGCHPTNGFFMHNGKASGYCYCITDDCTQSSASNSGLNIYKFSEVTNIQLVEEDMYCPNFVHLRSPANFGLKACAELVSLSKGKNGCHSTYDIFMHVGQDSGYCYCIKDECTEPEASASGLNIYQFAESKSLFAIYSLCVGDYNFNQLVVYMLDIIWLVKNLFQKKQYNLCPEFILTSQ